ALACGRARSWARRRWSRTTWTSPPARSPSACRPGCVRAPPTAATSPATRPGTCRTASGTSTSSAASTDSAKSDVVDRRVTHVLDHADLVGNEQEVQLGELVPLALEPACRPAAGRHAPAVGDDPALRNLTAHVHA